LFPFHKVCDGMSEERLSTTGASIGTTKQGIGPCYALKSGRANLRVCDLVDFDTDFPDKFRTLVALCRRMYGEFELDVEAEIERYRKIAAVVNQGMIIDSVTYMNNAFRAGKKILIESANAIMLDVDFGTYPYVTSSNPTIGGACTGLGLPPKALESTIGIVKAYSTRVGEGPFLSEELGDIGATLRTVGHERGTTTGRDRRCGWLDLVQLKYSTMINGYDQLCMTKSDVMDKFEEIKVVERYQLGDEFIDTVPASLVQLAKYTPVYRVFPGWLCDTTKIRDYDELPKNLRDYIEWIEEQLKVPFTCISVGPARDETLFRNARQQL